MRLRKHCLRAALVVLVALALPHGPARATPLHLRIHDRLHAVPGQPLQVFATIKNDTGSTISFVKNLDDFQPPLWDPKADDTIPTGSASAPVTDFYFGPNTTDSNMPFLAEFVGVVLRPHQVFHFVAATVILDPTFPIGQTTAPFSYTFGIIHWQDPLSLPVITLDSNTVGFSITAVGSANSVSTLSPVSEPSSWLVFSVGGLLAAVAGARGRKRRV